MKTINNYLHDIERYGFTPSKLYRRLFLSRQDLPKILSISIPKSGTNLLQRILTLHPLLYRRLLPTLGPRNRDVWSNLNDVFPKTKRGEIVSAHFDYDAELENYLLNDAGHKIIFTARDPRDIVISAMYYILKRPDHAYHAKLKGLRNEKEMLTALIRGDDKIRPIDQQIHRFVGWINPRVLYVKFEELVGAAGGGNDVLQRSTIQRIYTHLGMQLDDELLEFIASHCRSSKSQTFRRGMIRSWEIHFDSELKRIFKEVAGDLLIQLGYENGHDW